MPVRGRGRCGRESRRSSYAAVPASTICQLQLHPSHGKKRRTSSHNQNAKTEVDAKNRCGRFPAAQCERPGVRAHGLVSGDDVRSAVSWPRHGSMSIAVVVGWPPTCAYADMIRLKSNDAIPRREFVPRDPRRTNQL